MSSSTDTPKKPRRGVYLLPNLFTTAALFAGFFAIVSAINGRFESAAVAVFVAMVLDGLDGRVARMTNTQSEFGAEYDSLADVISFGLAPALVMYEWALSDLGKLGWLAAFVYVAGAALRLARFNTQLAVADKRFFQGLASPAAAANMVGLVWVVEEYGLKDLTGMAWVSFALTLISGLLMVSNMRYYSFKDLDLRGKVPFVAVVVVMLVFVLISIKPPVVLFGVFFLYAVSGPVTTVLLVKRKRKFLRVGKRVDSKDSEP